MIDSHRHNIEQMKPRQLSSYLLFNVYEVQVKKNLAGWVLTGGSMGVPSTLIDMFCIGICMIPAFVSWRIRQIGKGRIRDE